MTSNICFRGYVDDPRNTDNAWMETVAFNFHDPSGQEVCFNEDPLILLHFLKETLYLHRSGSYLCRQEMMLEQYSGCLSTKRYDTSHEGFAAYVGLLIDMYNMQVILYASHKDFVEKVVEKLEAHW